MKPSCATATAGLEAQRGSTGRRLFWKSSLVFMVAHVWLADDGSRRSKRMTLWAGAMRLLGGARPSFLGG